MIIIFITIYRQEFDERYLLKTPCTIPCEFECKNVFCRRPSINANLYVALHPFYGIFMKPIPSIRVTPPRIKSRPQVRENMAVRGS